MKLKAQTTEANSINGISLSLKDSSQKKKQLTKWEDDLQNGRIFLQTSIRQELYPKYKNKYKSRVKKKSNLIQNESKK